MIKQILQYFKIYQKYIGARLYIVFLLSGLAAVLEILGVAMVLPLLGVLDVGVGGEPAAESSNSHFLIGIFDKIGVGDSVIAILMFISLIFLIKGVLLYVAFAYQAYLKAELMGEMKQRMYDKISVMNYSYYMKKNTGYFVNILTIQITSMVQSFDKFKQFLSILLSTGIIISGAFLFSWKFALMALGLGIVCLFLFRNINGKVYLVSRKAVKENGELNKYLVQMIQSFKYITSTNQQSHLRGEVVRSIGNLVSYKKTQGYAQSLTQALMEPIAIILVLMIVAFYITFLKEPVLPILISLALFYRAMGGMLNIQQAWQGTLNKIGSLEIVEKELLKLEKNREVSGDHEIGPLSDSIRLQEVTFRYRNKKKAAISDVSLEIPVNSTCAFVGESGSGKSTMVDLITMMLRPEVGGVYVDNVPGEEIELRSWRSQIGFVSQESVMFDETIAHNISLLPPSEIEKNMDRIRAAAKQAYADIFIDQMPDKYETQIGDRGILLSGGQRQRIFLARELFKNPRLLILDEATSALDSESERFVTESIENIHGDTTILIIAHRLSSVANVDRLYVFDQGRIIEQGTYAELIAKKGAFCRMASLQLHHTGTPTGEGK